MSTHTSPETPTAEQDEFHGHTPGPWRWFGNAAFQSIYLATTHSGRRFVMEFKRWGMSGAQPVFQPPGGIMVPASELIEFEVGDPSIRGIQAARDDESVYRYCIRGIGNTDAKLIEAAPEILKQRNEARVDLAKLREENAELRRVVARAYASGYGRGHHDTVEARYTDVHYSDRDTYFAEEAEEIINDGLSSPAPETT